MTLSLIIRKFKKYLDIWVHSTLLQFSALCGAYGIGVTVFLIAKLAVGEHILVISILSNGAHLLTLFCIPALLLTLIVKDYRFPWSLYLLPGTLAFILWYGGDFLPKFPVAADPEAIDIRVMTYNTKDSGIAVGFVAENSMDADIVGLQEVIPRMDNQFDNLYQRDTKAVFTHYPIVSEQPISIYRLNSNRTIAAVKIEVEISNHVVSVYSLHAFRPSLTIRPFVYVTDLRYRDIQALVNAVASDPNPAIVLCDCNFSDQTEDYKLMTTQLHDTWKERGMGLGLTAPAPAGEGDFPFLLLRSDYIWHTDEFEAIAIDVMPIDLSDHYPVIAQLRFHIND